MKITGKRKVLAIIGTLIILMSVFASFEVNAATRKWVTGCYNGYKQTGCTTVYLTNTKKDAYINVYNYNLRGKEDKSEYFRVFIKNANGKLLYAADVKSGTKLRLGNDHKKYKICFSWSPKTEDYFNGTCVKYWAIKAKTNCYM
ncbi:MAG: hypothetical protein IJ725_01410 [Ruminococcus sp.]|nr:hypothetical protein [Ruminococcus sp.]